MINFLYGSLVLLLKHLLLKTAIQRCCRLHVFQTWRL